MKKRIQYLAIRGLIGFSIISIFLYFQNGMSAAKPFILIVAACLVLLVLIPTKSTPNDSNNNSTKKIK